MLPTCVQAKNLFKLSTSKALKVYDFFVSCGWLPAPLTAKQPQPPPLQQQEQQEQAAEEPSAPTPEAAPIEGVCGPAATAEGGAEDGALLVVKTEGGEQDGNAVAL